MTKKDHASHSQPAAMLLSYTRALADHGVIIAIVLGLLLLIYSVYAIQSIFDQPPDDTYKQTQIIKNSVKSFDKVTMEQVEQLHTSQDGPIPLPGGKINPFIE